MLNFWDKDGNPLPLIFHIICKSKEQLRKELKTVYNQQQQQIYYAPPQQTYRVPYVPPNLKGRPVSSIDEVRATSIDFDGSVFYFPDLANKKIYTKQFNLDGTVSLLMYSLTEIPVNSPTPQDFVTRQEFEALLAQLNASPKPQEKPTEFKF